MPKHLGWTDSQTELLGTDTDENIAKILGIGAVAVGRRRRLLGIPSYCQSTVSMVPPEADRLLGTMSDAALAAKLGVSLASVYKRRTKIGIAPFGSHPGRKWTEKEDRLLGTMSDVDLATKLGTTEGIVHDRRFRKKLSDQIGAKIKEARSLLRSKLDNN
jgi:hypothetical protein